jgi:hypothetical protein
MLSSKPAGSTFVSYSFSYFHLPSLSTYTSADGRSLTGLGGPPDGLAMFPYGDGALRIDVSSHILKAAAGIPDVPSWPVPWQNVYLDRAVVRDHIRDSDAAVGYRCLLKTVPALVILSMFDVR